MSSEVVSLCAAGSVPAYRACPSQYNAIPRCCHSAMLTPSPSLKTPGAVQSQGSLPGLGYSDVGSYWRAGVSWCTRLAWEACQAPFSRGSPISFQALKSRMKIIGEKEKQRPRRSQTPRHVPGAGPHRSGWHACNCVMALGWP